MKSMNIYSIPFFIIVLLLQAGCANMKSIKYLYSDGNGNTYKIGHLDGRSLEYIPVRPEMSSSGEYDGGEPVRKSLTEKNMEQIADLLNRAISHSAVHIQNRVKGSGLIVKSEGGAETAIIISGDSDEKRKIEILLKQLTAD